MEKSRSHAASLSIEGKQMGTAFNMKTARQQRRVC